jgi:hypothetical protein
MLGRNTNQIDVFTQMIYDRLIAKDHLLVKISSVIDFSFVEKQWGRFETTKNITTEKLLKQWGRFFLLH